MSQEVKGTTLKALIQALKDCNNADISASDDMSNDLPYHCVFQTSTYGHIANAIVSLVGQESYDGMIENGDWELPKGYKVS